MNLNTDLKSAEKIKEAYEKSIGIDEILSTHKELPHPFIPATTKFFNEQFYWDSFFIMQGIKSTKKGREIILGMIENFFVMLDKYNYIPNSFNSYDSRTQPPFLSSMVLLGYEINKDKIWLKKAYKYIKLEYTKTWTKKPRQASIGLSIYSNNDEPLNKNDPSYGAMQECGWDNTLRFGGFIDSKNKTYVNESRVHKICPVDLNCLIYKYEKDLENIAKIIDLSEDKIKWKQKAKHRKELINKYMWDEKEGFYFDYDIQKKEKVNFKSLAAYFSLWTKLATKSQGNKIISKLNIFEKEGGLACTELKGMSEGIQWGYPNGWAPLHFITIEGLKKYGFNQEAERITNKWMKNCATRFIETGKWDEKLNVDQKYKRVDDARYSHQSCTSWTLFLFKYFYETK